LEYCRQLLKVFSKKQRTYRDALKKYKVQVRRPEPTIKDTIDKKKKIVVKRLKGDLKKLVNRTFTTGFLFGECREKGQETRFSHTKEEYEFVREVINLEFGIWKVKS